jgi:hypothetical protein
MGGTTAVVKGKRQLTAHPSDGSTVDTAHPGTGTVFYSIADRDNGGRLQHRLFVEETHGNSEKEDDFGLNDGDGCLDDFSDGQTECFDPGGGDGERVSDAVFEDLDGQGVRTECPNHESCEDVGASIPALPRPDGGSLECTDPPGPCQPPGAAPEWPMDFATKFRMEPPRGATNKKSVKKAEQKGKAMRMHDGTAPHCPPPPRPSSLDQSTASAILTPQNSDPSRSPCSPAAASPDPPHATTSSPAGSPIPSQPPPQAPCRLPS